MEVLYEWNELRCSAFLRRSPSRVWLLTCDAAPRRKSSSRALSSARSGWSWAPCAPSRLPLAGGPTLPVAPGRTSDRSRLSGQQH